jgi:CheY-like chemotaxis protein
MDGGQLLQCIRAYRPESGKRIPAIAATSYTREFASSEIVKAGFDRFLPKPLEPERLVAEILELVDA